MYLISQDVLKNIENSEQKSNAKGNQVSHIKLGDVIIQRNNNSKNTQKEIAKYPMPNPNASDGTPPPPVVVNVQTQTGQDKKEKSPIERKNPNIPNIVSHSISTPQTENVQPRHIFHYEKPSNYVNENDIAIEQVAIDKNEIENPSTRVPSLEITPSSEPPVQNAVATTPVSPMKSRVDNAINILKNATAPIDQNMEISSPSKMETQAQLSQLHEPTEAANKVNNNENQVMQSSESRKNEEQFNLYKDLLTASLQNNNEIVSKIEQEHKSRRDGEWLMQMGRLYDNFKRSLSYRDRENAEIMRKLQLMRDQYDSAMLQIEKQKSKMNLRKIRKLEKRKKIDRNRENIRAITEKRLRDLSKQFFKPLKNEKVKLDSNIKANPTVNSKRKKLTDSKLPVNDLIMDTSKIKPSTGAKPKKVKIQNENPNRSPDPPTATSGKCKA